MPTKSKSSTDVKKSAKAFAQAGEKLVKDVLSSKPVKDAAIKVDKTAKKIVNEVKTSPKVKQTAKKVRTEGKKVVDSVASTKTQETIKVKGEELLGKVKELVKEGNVRRIIISDKNGKQILVLPLTLGVVGALVAPVLAAVGAVAALVTECSITVERETE